MPQAVRVGVVRGPVGRCPAPRDAGEDQEKQDHKEDDPCYAPDIAVLLVVRESVDPRVLQLPWPVAFAVHMAIAIAAQRM